MIKVIDIKRVEYSVTEPVTLTEVKTHLHVTDSDNDTELTALITQCRKSVEEFCLISIVNKRITLTADFDCEWELPYGPVIGIESVETRDTTIGSGIPSFSTLTEGWEITGEEFKEFYTSSTLRHKLIYTAGYQTVPIDLKLAVLNEIYFRYENKGQNNEDICKAARELAISYKRMIWI